MSANPIKRVRVWSAGVRLAHWSMALAVLALLLTGWLMHSAPTIRASALAYHWIAAYVLLLALALRLYLLAFGAGAAGWRDCLPVGAQRRAVLEMLRFYFSFGRSPLPNWYGHNPLWGPIYLLWFLLLALELVTGFTLHAPYLVAGVSIGAIHAWVARFIGGLVAAHVAAVFMHDLKGANCDVSAMISGYRYFVIEKPDAPLLKPGQVLPLDELRKWTPRETRGRKH
ncbi:MAG: cytochrome b/b6 domain-containing protein [Gammaproteobacteria bacterium]